tara:strand:- start:1964 stop:2419 length:456 start_codon:yes stop_codon:yes gene_type:complete
MLFFKKKKKKDSKFDHEVPEFHTLASEKQKTKNPELSKFPSYDQEFGTIKQEISKPIVPPKISIPKREKRFSKPEKTSFSGDKPIFVKIDNYKEAMSNINSIKTLCREADGLLNNIHKIRENEDKELEKWHHDLDKVKDKLLIVDKKLFEL